MRVSYLSRNVNVIAHNLANFGRESMVSQSWGDDFDSFLASVTDGHHYLVME